MPDVPAIFETFTSMAPAVPAGTTAVIELLELTTYEVAGVEPNTTPVIPVKLLPMIVMLFPPEVEPDDADRPVTVGGRTGVVNVSRSFEEVLEVPYAVVTWTST